MYSSTSARSAVISIRLAPSRTMASRSKLRSDRSSSPTTMLNMGVPSMDGLSAALGLQQTGGYATLLSPNSIHNFGLYPPQGAKLILALTDAQWWRCLWLNHRRRIVGAARIAGGL